LRNLRTAPADVLLGLVVTWKAGYLSQTLGAFRSLTSWSAGGSGSTAVPT
jgi:hypothetical protein